MATDLYVPRERGPFPLVVLAHGKDGSPERLTMLASGWASAGYVVAVPYFPLTNDGIDGGARIPDYVNQPEDVSFVIDEMLRLSALDHGALSQRIDPDRIGVAGHSLGAATAYAVAFNSCCLDRRIDATILMAGRRFPFRGEYTLDGVAAMWVHGDADLSLPHADSAEAYAQAASPKALVTLLGGSHSPPFEDTPDPHDRVVTLVTLDFWDAYLLGDSRANERIRADGEEPGLATVDYVP
ncbi:MAG: hypothetical protein M5T61_12145 [Acidimicrobiia bacterium]|nr:hypothetical protein [Acidimicrobiia bacterium]